MEFPVPRGRPGPWQCSFGFSWAHRPLWPRILVCSVSAGLRGRVAVASVSCRGSQHLPEGEGRRGRAPMGKRGSVP